MVCTLSVEIMSDDETEESAGSAIRHSVPVPGLYFQQPKHKVVSANCMQHPPPSDSGEYT